MNDGDKIEKWTTYYIIIKAQLPRKVKLIYDAYFNHYSHNGYIIKSEDLFDTEEEALVKTMEILNSLRLRYMAVNSNSASTEIVLQQHFNDLMRKAENRYRQLTQINKGE
jgi:hypothetical protein